MGMSRPGCLLYPLDSPTQPELVRFWPSTSTVTPLRSWTSHRQLASLFCPAITCLLHGHGRPSHRSALKLWWIFGGHEAALLGWAMPHQVDDRLRNMVRADRDEKMKARCRMPKQHLAGYFLTRVHPGIGLPGCRRQYRHQAGPLSSRAGMLR